MHALFSSKERAYWETKVAVAASNSKKRWQILNKLICKDVKSQIPDSAIADAFSKFFSQKVESVRSASGNAALPSFPPCPKPCCFDTFQPLTTGQVLILIKRAPDKTLDLDPVPTWLVRFLHLSLRMFSMLVFKRVVFLLCRKRQLFIRAWRNHCLTQMIWLIIVSSQTLALFLSWAGCSCSVASSS